MSNLLMFNGCEVLDLIQYKASFYFILLFRNKACKCKPCKGSIKNHHHCAFDRNTWLQDFPEGTIPANKSKIIRAEQFTIETELNAGNIGLNLNPYFLSMKLSIKY